MTTVVATGAAPRRRGAAPDLLLIVLVLVAAVSLVVVILGPMLGVVRASFGDGLSLEAYREALTNPSSARALVRSLLFAVIVTVAAVGLGFPVAYALTRVRPAIRNLLFLLLILPYLASLIVRTFAWIGFLGIAGPISAISNALGLGKSSLVGTFIAVLLVLLHVYLPYVILLVWISMRRIGADQMPAAQSLGASRVEAFWSVYAPQALPGAIAAGVLVFVITAGMVGVPALIGGTDQTTIAVLIVQQVTSGYGLRQDIPAAQAVLLTLVVFAILWWGFRTAGADKILGINAARGSSASMGRVGGRAMSRAAGRVFRAKRSRGVFLGGSVALALVIVVGPILYLLGMSFQPLPLLKFPTSSVSFRWYEKVFGDAGWLEALTNSLQIAAMATVLALVMAAALAALTLRVPPKWSPFIVAVAVLPLLLPVVSFAPGLFDLYSRLGWIGSPVAIALAHAVLALPYAYVPLLNALMAHDTRLEAASMTLGASRARTFMRVTLPLLAPAAIAAAVLAFVFSLDEFTATLFLSGISFETLPIRFFSAARQNLSPELAAVGVMLVLSVFAIVAVGSLLVRMLTRRTREDAR